MVLADMVHAESVLSLWKPKILFWFRQSAYVMNPMSKLGAAVLMNFTDW